MPTVQLPPRTSTAVLLAAALTALPSVAAAQAAPATPPATSAAATARPPLPSKPQGAGDPKKAAKPAADGTAAAPPAAPATGAAAGDASAPRREGAGTAAAGVGVDAPRSAQDTSTPGAGIPALTPPPPPPWINAPTSVSGSQLLAPGGVAGGASGTAFGAPPAADQEARIRALEARLEADEALERKEHERYDWLRRFKVGGYLQPQLLWQSFNTAASPNLSATGALPAGISANAVTAKADGTTTNGDFFRFRRARLKTEFMPTDYARFVMEIDPFPNGGFQGAGTGTIARNVEAIGIVHWTQDIQTEFGVGMFKLPFGYEVLQTDADRPFIERSWSENNLTPAEFDTGARAYTTAMHKRLTVQAAFVNGVTLGEKNFTVVPDLSRGKDIVGRVNYNFGCFDLGVSGLYGQGQQTDAASLKFKQYPRWGANLEGAVHHTFSKRLGQSRLFGELTLAKNLDRGTKYAFGPPAIPSNVNDDVVNEDERGLFVRLEQDVTEWFTFALRYDMYTPDSAQKNDARDTYGFVGVVHFTKGLQLMAEVDHAIDNVHRPGAASPSKQIETFSSVLQARF